VEAAEGSQNKETELMGEPVIDDEWQRRYEAIYRVIDEGLDRLEEQFSEFLLLSSIGKECKAWDGSDFQPSPN
jgi:hypothetical protein